MRHLGYTVRLTETHLVTCTITFPLGFIILYMGLPRMNITGTREKKVLLPRLPSFTREVEINRGSPIERVMRAAGTRNARE